MGPALLRLQAVGRPVGEAASRLRQPDAVHGAGAAHVVGDEGGTVTAHGNRLQAARAQPLADREQAQAARDESRRLREETHRALEDALAQEEQAQVSSGAAAYSTMRELRRQLDLLCRDEPSKRSLLLAMGELRKAIDQELARAPVVVPRALQVGDRVHVRSLGRDGVLNQIDTRASLAVVDFGASPVTVALDEVEAA